MKRSGATILGILVLLCVTGLTAYVAWKALSFGLSPTVATAAVTLVSALVVQAVASALQRRRELELEQRKKKAEVYQIFLDWWFDDFVLKSALERNRQDGGTGFDEAAMKRFGEFTKQLTLWGGDEVLKHYASYRRASAGRSDQLQVELAAPLIGLEQLFLAFRRDLGFRNRHINVGDVLSLFVNDIHSEASSIAASNTLESSSTGKG